MKDFSGINVFYFVICLITQVLIFISFWMHKWNQQPANGNFAFLLLEYEPIKSVIHLAIVQWTLSVATGKCDLASN